MNLNYITFNEKKTTLNGSRVKSIIKKLENTKTNKLEMVPFKGLGAKITETLDNSDFTKVRKLNSKQMIRNGMSAMFAFPHDGGFLVDTMCVIDYLIIGKKEYMVKGSTGKTYNYGGQEYPIITEVKYVNGVPTLSRYIDVESRKGIESISIEEDYTYKANVLPVEIFWNNEEKLSDIDLTGVGEDLVRLDYFDSKVREEWELTRTMPVFNSNFTDVNPADEVRALKNGRGYMSEDSFNAKMGTGQSINQATNGSIILQQNIVFLEDDIYKKLGLQRDTINSGSNNHDLEVITSGIDNMETLLATREMREQYYNRFLSKLATLLGETFTKITLEISPLEQAKIDLLNAKVGEAQIKAQNIQSQKDASTADNTQDNTDSTQ